MGKLGPTRKGTPLGLRVPYTRTLEVLESGASGAGQLNLPSRR